MIVCVCVRLCLIARRGVICCIQSVRALFMSPPANFGWPARFGGCFYMPILAAIKTGHKDRKSQADGQRHRKRCKRVRVRARFCQFSWPRAALMSKVMAPIHTHAHSRHTQTINKYIYFVVFMPVKPINYGACDCESARAPAQKPHYGLVRCL